MKRGRVLGLNIDRVTKEEAVERVESLVNSGSSHLVVTLNAEMLMASASDPLFREILTKAHLVVADGMGVVAASRLLGQPVPERLPGVDLMHALLDRGAKSGWRVFFLGAQPQVVAEAVAVAEKAYPGLHIVGFHHGYFPSSHQEQVLATIAESRPDLLFAALGSPRQEKWLAGHLAELDVSVGVGVGGSFDVLAGRCARAPQWMQRIGLEWAFRVWQQPSRILRLRWLPAFVVALLYAKLFSKESDRCG